MPDIRYRWMRPPPPGVPTAGDASALAAYASLPNRGATAASAPMKLLARSNCRRRRPRAVRNPSRRSWSLSPMCMRRSAVRLSNAPSLISCGRPLCPFRRRSAAAEEIAAIVMIYLQAGLGVAIVLVWQAHCLLTTGRSRVGLFGALTPPSIPRGLLVGRRA